MKAVVVKGNCDLEIMEIGEPQIIGHPDEDSCHYGRYL